MNVYISQGMRGKTDKEIAVERKRMAARTILAFDKKGEKVEIINNIIIDNKDIVGELSEAEINKERVRCLGFAIKALADADLVVFQDNWGDYAGCSVEHKICEEYNIPRLYMEDLEEDGK